MSASSERRAGVGVGDAEMATGLQSRGFSAREVRILSLVDQDYSAAEIIEILQAGGRDDDPARPLDRAVAGVAPEGRSAAVILLAGLLCAAIFVADLIFGGDDSPILYLLVVPVAILAMEFTTMGALVGAAVATLLLGIAALVTSQDLDTAAFLAQVAAFGLVAVVVGVMSARMHVLTRKLDIAERESGLETLVGAVDAAARPEGSPRPSA
jgi:hypothetical protein